MKTNPPKVAFIGAGSTVFVKNIVGDILLNPVLSGTRLALMDIDETRLRESADIVAKMITSCDADMSVSTHATLEPALDGADFVITAFQIGGYEPCTVTDFEIPKAFGLRQTIGDTLGIGGIMRGLRTVPHLWDVCATMERLCPDALLMNYINPMAINTWAVTARYPNIRQVGLCHSVQGTVSELARDLGLPASELRYRTAGINHMAFFLELDHVGEDGSVRPLKPMLLDGYEKGEIPLPSSWNPRCPNLVRYEVLKQLGYFVTESSEHFAEYVPWFIKPHRPDLIDTYQIPLDEYPKRCEEQIRDWSELSAELSKMERMEVTESEEFAADIIAAAWGGPATTIYGNIANQGWIPQLPEGAAVEVPCRVDETGITPTVVSDIPAHLLALIRSNLAVQELTVKAILEEDRESIVHAAFMDPRTAADLDLRQIREMVDQLIAQHGDWLPDWTRAG